MVALNLDSYLRLLPVLEQAPDKNIWLSYDAEGDVLYIHFTQAGRATDSELTDDDIIVRYEGDDVIGYSILHASERSKHG